MTCLGIDLGTTNSLAAIFDSGEATLLSNALGEVQTPSVVGLGDDQKAILVGKPARMRLIRHPDLTVSRFKRQMGTGKQFPLGRKRAYTALELSAIVLKTLKSDAEAVLGHNVTEAVISVPAYFNGIQRQATKDAAEIAGFVKTVLINEPTAAALAAGVQDREGESTFIVLDLGGGTFDVSILEMFEGVMEVRASSGDAALGGEDFTAKLAQYFAKENQIDWATLPNAGRETLLNAANEMKMRLTTAGSAATTVSVDGKTLSLSIDSHEFEALTADLITRLRKPIEASLYDAGIAVEDIDRVILVGGATRMPAVRSLAARIFRKLPERSVDPDHAIAIGAAIQAGLIARHEGLKDLVMTDVAPFSLGIQTVNDHGGKKLYDRFAPLIERNTILPASRSAFFSTIADNQSQIVLRIFQGESALASENLYLGSLEIDIPPAPKGRESIDVRFTYDVSGLLAVDVRVLSTGVAYQDVIENLAGAMSAAEKTTRLKQMDALKVSPRDMAENVALIETLKHLYEILLGQEREMVAAMLEEFDLALEAQDPAVIGSVRERLGGIVRQIEASYVR